MREKERARLGCAICTTDGDGSFSFHRVQRLTGYYFCVSGLHGVVFTLLVIDVNLSGVPVNCFWIPIAPRFYPWVLLLFLALFYSVVRISAAQLQPLAKCG